MMVCTITNLAEIAFISFGVGTIIGIVFTCYVSKSCHNIFGKKKNKELLQEGE